MIFVQDHIKYCLEVLKISCFHGQIQLVQPGQIQLQGGQTLQLQGQQGQPQQIIIQQPQAAITAGQNQVLYILFSDQ